MKGFHRQWNWRAHDGTGTYPQNLMIVHDYGVPMTALSRTECTTFTTALRPSPPVLPFAHHADLSPYFTFPWYPVQSGTRAALRGPLYEGIRTFIPLIGPRHFPIRPLWPGFLINTLFYAAVLYTLLVTKRSLTYSRRYLKHRCPTCGYDLKGLTTCPECGKLPVAPLSGP